MSIDLEESVDLEQEEEEEAVPNQRKFKLTSHLYTSGSNGRLVLATFKKKRHRGQSVPDKTQKTSVNKKSNELTRCLNRIKSERGKDIHSSQVKCPTSNYYPQSAKDEIIKQIRIHNRKIALDPFRTDYKSLLNNLAPLNASKRKAKPVEEDIDVNVNNTEYKLVNNRYDNNEERQRNADINIVAMVSTKSVLTRNIMFYYYSHFTSSQISFNTTSIEMLVISGSIIVCLDDDNRFELDKLETFRVPEKIAFTIEVQESACIYITLINNGCLKGTECWREHCDNSVFLKSEDE